MTFFGTNLSHSTSVPSSSDRRYEILPTDRGMAALSASAKATNSPTSTLNCAWGAATGGAGTSSGGASSGAGASSGTLPALEGMNPPAPAPLTSSTTPSPAGGKSSDAGSGNMYNERSQSNATGSDRPTSYTLSSNSVNIFSNSCSGVVPSGRLSVAQNRKNGSFRAARCEHQKCIHNTTPRGHRSEKFNPVTYCS